MVIALDIDDTITRHPEFFAFLTQSLRRAGHEVLIITFRQDRAGAEADLDEWGITFSRLITFRLEDCRSEDITQWKAQVCREHRVDIFFEDCAEVVAHVDEATLCLVVR